MKTLLPLFILMLLAGCAAPVNVDYDHATNFAALKTYRVADKPVSDSQDPRISNPFMYQRIVSAIDNSLSAKGMSRTDNKAADVSIEYHLQVKQEIYTDDTGVSFGFGSGSRHSAIGFVYNIPIGTTNQQDNMIITIDVVDNRDGKLLWRGSYGQTIYDGSRPESNTRKVNYIVGEILNKYPPR